MLFSDKPKQSSLWQIFLKGISKILAFERRNIIPEMSDIQIMKEQGKHTNMGMNLNKHRVCKSIIVN